MKHQPASALPWKASKARRASNFGDYASLIQNASWNVGKIYGAGKIAAVECDAAYIAHAANLYGPLVDALRAIDPNHPVLKQAGEA